jgi:hypothetical protein
LSQTTVSAAVCCAVRCDMVANYSRTKVKFNQKYLLCHSFPQGMNCLSDDPITFHYVPGIRMMTYDYLIYQMKINQSQQSNP